MKKTLVTVAFTCAMLFFGTAAFLHAEESQEQVADGTVQFTTNSIKILNGIGKNYEIKLKANLVKLPHVDGKTFGYRLGDTFVPLSEATTSVEASGTQILDFGYASEAGEDFTDFEKRKVAFSVSSDPGYYAGYLNDGFYQLDFSKDPFDGVIDIVIGEPLPAPAVTLVVALAAGALFLLYKNRRQRLIQTEQA